MSPAIRAASISPRRAAAACTSSTSSRPRARTTSTPISTRTGAGAQAAGVARGVYHFMTWCSLASEQAAWFMRERAQRSRRAAAGARSRVEQPFAVARTSTTVTDVLEKVRVMLAAMEAPHRQGADHLYRHELLPRHPRTASTSTIVVLAALHRRRAAHQIWRARRGYSGSGRRPVRCRASAPKSTATPSTAAEEWVTFLLTGCDPRTARSGSDRRGAARAQK